jgi:hypothetical protein
MKSSLNRREFCGLLTGGGLLAGGAKAGTGTAAEKAAAPPAGYLFAHMTRKDYGRLYYALSRDGRHWRPVNGGRRVLPEYRGHPDLMRGHDGRFYLTGNRPHRDGTIRFWVSDDLIHWTHLRDFVADMTDHPGYESPDPWHGAPKLFYDTATRTYLLTWHFSNARKLKELPENYWSGMKTFYVTSKDLRTFSKARRLFPDFKLATIDVIVRREAGRYYALLKDERYPDFGCPTGKTIRVASADHLTGPWSAPGPPISPNFREAPTVIPRPDGRGWYLYFEQYPGLHYDLATAPRLAGPWYDEYAPNYRPPEGARHGCMLALTAPQYAALHAAFSDKPSAT